MSLAVKSGQQDIVAQLLHHGSDISFAKEQTDQDETSPYSDLQQAYRLVMLDSISVWIKPTFTGALLESFISEACKGVANQWIKLAISARNSELTPLHPVKQDGKNIVQAFNSSDEPKEDVMLCLCNNGFFQKQLADYETTHHYCLMLLVKEIERGHIKVVERLLDLECDINESIRSYHDAGPSILCVAVESKQLPVVRMLLERGADPNGKLSKASDIDRIYAENIFRPTPLLRAVRRSQDSQEYDRTCETVSLLIKFGANIDAQDSNGSTALHLATKYGLPELVEALLEKNANPNIPNKAGEIPLHLPVYVGADHATRIVGLLIPRTRDVNHRDNLGNTPLIELVRNNSNFDAVKLLIDHGAKDMINAFSDSKGTALQNSTWWCSLEMMSLLIDNGADPNLVKGQRNSPLMGVASVLQDGPQFIKFLLEHGAHATWSTADGKTALHEVVDGYHNGYEKSAELLLQYGADANAVWTGCNISHYYQDSTMITPLALALRRKDAKMVKLLLKHGADQRHLSPTALERVFEVLEDLNGQDQS